MYFDISARQSLDVLLQVRKLNREMTRRLFSDILKLCDEMDKYLLNLRKVSFRSRHIMYSQEQNNFHFLYNFSTQGEQWQQDLIQFSEMLVERLDYGDDKLMEVIYRFYEMLTDSKETVSLRGLAQMVLNAVSDQEKEDSDSVLETDGCFTAGAQWGGAASGQGSRASDDGLPDRRETPALSGMDPDAFSSAEEKTFRVGKRKAVKTEGEAGGKAAKAEYEAAGKVSPKGREVVGSPNASPVKSRYKKSLLLEMLLLLAADAASVFLVEPGNLPVILLQIAAALICLVMIFRQLWLKKKVKKEQETRESEQEDAAAQEFREEFESLMQTGDQILSGTQIIAMEEVFPKLYSVYGRKPEYIEIVGHQLIGSQEDLVQVCLHYSGVSRIHASLRRDPQGNSVLEDLNSTNGTWVNDSRLSPRVPYTLKRGDKVSFAGCDYIFR